MTLAQIRGGFGQPESPNLQRSAAGYGSGNDAVELCYTSLHRSPPTCSITSNALILSQPLAKRPHKSCGKQLPPVFFQLDQRHSRNDDEGGGQPPRTHASNDLGTSREVSSRDSFQRRLLWERGWSTGHRGIRNHGQAFSQCACFR
ncbi:aspartic-type endopeptidase (CtsD) [Apiospora arundinis]